MCLQKTINRQKHRNKWTKTTFIRVITQTIVDIVFAFELLQGWEGRKLNREILPRGWWRYFCSINFFFVALSSLLLLEAMFSSSTAWQAVKDWLHYVLNCLDSALPGKNYDVSLNCHVRRGRDSTRRLRRCVIARTSNRKWQQISWIEEVQMIVW